MKWAADGWPLIDEGRGPSSAAPAPLGVGGRAEAEFFDGFTNARLGPEWQWPLGNEQSARVEVAGGGRLVLEPLKAQGDAFTGAVVARRTTAGDYVATALVVARGASGGARAGLAAYGWRESAAGVAAGGGKVTVWRREGREERTVASADAPQSELIYLRMTAEGGERYRFAFSANGRDWKKSACVPVVKLTYEPSCRCSCSSYISACVAELSVTSNCTLPIGWADPLR